METFDNGDRFDILIFNKINYFSGAEPLIQVESELRLSDSLGDSSADSQILIGSEGNVRETIEHNK